MIREELESARKELPTKTKSMIEYETAAKWGARAVAAWELYKSTGLMSWFMYFVEFRHEATEHAAEAFPGTLERVRAELDELMGVGK